ncbi:hypothetical protein [Deinococcus carri]
MLLPEDALPPPGPRLYARPISPARAAGLVICGLRALEGVPG